ncbi:MAG: hypothetical protein J2P53_17595 [Bradyrhizobiaceae bacterium]|nr:hypothetical protein [Bradyrhizobiaceae bacterium]
MTNSLKVILTAVGIAVLASPVMAQPESQAVSNPHAAAISRAHGSAVRTPANSNSQLAPVPRWNRIDDCVHVQFPQCGGS